QSHCIENMMLKLNGQGGMTCATAAAMDLAVATGWGDFESVVRAQAPLFRCVVGNPFRPVAFNPSWRTSAVIGLARAPYDDRAFDEWRIVADALKEAGGADAEVLGHCRSPGPHVGGWWVVVLFLEKK